MSTDLKARAKFCFGVMLGTIWFVAGIFLFLSSVVLAHPIRVNPYIATTALLVGFVLFATVIAAIIEDPSRRRRSA